MAQVFRASIPRTFPDGSIGYAPGGMFDCIGPFAKVSKCLIDLPTGQHGPRERKTVYATGTADTFFSIPACTRLRGKHVPGWIGIQEDGSPIFNPVYHAK